jgi:branched-chain amino acid transport system substrate-binding protein
MTHSSITETNSSEFRVAIAATLTGRRTAHAKLFQTAFDFLIRNGISTLIADDASTPQQALAIADGFVREKAKVVVGHFNSSCAKSVIPFYRDQGITLLLPASSDVGIDVGNGVYRLCSTDADQAKAIANWVKKLPLSALPVAVRIDGSDYAYRLLACLQREFGQGLQSAVLTTAQIPFLSPVCIVVAVAHRAIEFVENTLFPKAQTKFLFSDEAAVAQFCRSAIRQAINCWIVAPDPSYNALLRRACNWLVEWNGLHSANINFDEWAISTGHLLPSGAAVRSGWRLCPPSELTGKDIF